MGIKLNWALPEGVSLDKVVIYRGTQRISTGALPAPLAELAPDTVAYEDATVASGNIYYYVISLVKGAQVSFSSNYEIGYFSSTGPGPQELLRGTWEKGYFGTVSDAEFLSFMDIKEQLAGLPAPNGVSGGWHKLIYKGKILFFPFQDYSSVMAINSVYAAGAVFGDDTNGAFLAGASMGTPRKQDAKVVKDGFELRVRVPKVLDPTKIHNSYASYAGTEIGELLELLYSERDWDYGVGKERLADQMHQTMRFWTNSWYTASYINLINGYGAVTNTAPGTGWYYRPILELVL
jgi:hypothetical protein